MEIWFRIWLLLVELFLLVCLDLETEVGLKMCKRDKFDFWWWGAEIKLLLWLWAVDTFKCAALVLILSWLRLLFLSPLWSCEPSSHCDDRFLPPKNLDDVVFLLSLLLAINRFNYLYFLPISLPYKSKRLCYMPEVNSSWPLSNSFKCGCWTTYL